MCNYQVTTTQNGFGSCCHNSVQSRASHSCLVASAQTAFQHVSFHVVCDVHSIAECRLPAFAKSGVAES